MESYCRASTSYNKKTHLNILIVDDDEHISEMFKDILEDRGHNVVTLNEGVRCISNMEHHSYDLIFLDYHIGDIDGVDLADFIKDIFKSKALIFAFTGDNSQLAINKYKAGGMNGAIIKPIDINLINKIMNQIENREKNDKTIVHKIETIKDKNLLLF